MPSIYDLIGDPTKEQAPSMIDPARMAQVQKQQELLKLKAAQQAQNQMPPTAKANAGILPTGETQVTPMQAQPAQMPQSPNAIQSIEDQIKAIMNQRGSELDTRRNDLAQLQTQKPTGIQALDLSPLYNFVDARTGSKMQQGYQAPTAINDWQSKVDALKKAVDTNGDKITDDQLKYLQEKLKQQADLDKVNALTGKASNLSNLASIREDALAARVAQTLQDNKILNDQNTRRQQLGLANHTLNGPNVITYQMFNEIQKDIANAITGAKSATVSDTAAMKIQTVEADLANLMQRATGNPQDAVSPEIRKYLSNVITRLDDAYANNIEDRKKVLAAGYSNLASTRVKNVVNDKIKALGQVPKNVTEVQKTITNKPATIVQNGHTYTLNPQTGEYE